MGDVVDGWLNRAVNARKGELGPLLWATAYHFFVLSAYYVLRPIRDEMGVAGGVENLPWLFTGTLVAMLLAHPIYTSAVGQWPRRLFVPWTYRFFELNLVVFFVLLLTGTALQNVWVGRAFFIWTSVFNLFVVSVFWSFMADVFRTEQGKRLFGFIAVGGTVGAITGSGLTTLLVGLVGQTNLLLVSVVLLEAAVVCFRRLDRSDVADAMALGGAASADGAVAAPRADERIGGGVLDGVKHVARSPYLLGIVGFMLFYTISSTFLYFQQADIVSRVFEDRAQRTQVFGAIDLVVNVLTVGLQVFVTGRVLKWLGVGLTLAFLPAVTLVGFAGLGMAPVLAVLVVFQVLRRASNYGLSRPAREVLYLVLPRDDKYKAKNFVDTFVYRAGDQVGAWSYAALGWLGLGLSGLAFSMVPIAALWLGLGLWLGKEQQRRSGTPVSSEPAPAPAPAGD